MNDFSLFLILTVSCIHENYSLHFFYLKNETAFNKSESSDVVL